MRSFNGSSGPLLMALVIMSIVGTPSHLRAQESKTADFFRNLISGYLMVYDYMDISRPLDEAEFLDRDYEKGPWLRNDRAGLRLQLRLSGSVTDDVSFDTTMNFDFDAAKAVRSPRSPLSDGVALYFKEGFISIRDIFGRLDLKIGRQYIFWGRFEWGGALDVISPWDYANMSAEKENFRQAVDAVNLAIDLNPVTITLLAIPIFAPNRVPYKLPGAMGDSGELRVIDNDADMPDLSLQNMEAGGVANIHLNADGEMSFYYFYGFDRTFSMNFRPIYPEDFQVTPSALEFTARYHHQHVAGMDFEYFAGPVTLMFEAGYFHTMDSAGDNVFIPNPTVQVAAGLEFEYESELSLQALVSYTRVLSYDRQAEYDAMVALGDPSPYVERTNQNTFMYRIRYTPITELSLSLMQIVNFYDWDFMTLAFASWEIVSGLKLYAGVVAFRGPDGTTFGRLERQARLFGELKYSF